MSQSKRNPVKSAEIVAFYRAYGFNDSKAKNPDGLARYFLGFKTQLLLNIPTQLGKRILERMHPGEFWYFQARTKHIDDSLTKAIHAGIEQVVILGAGYDTRPYRFRDSLVNIKVFEVDLVSTQNEKKKKLVKLLGSLPENVDYVPIDFNSQSIEEVLTATEYDPNRKTFFIWEGVTCYLPESSVIMVLEFVKSHSAPGSLIVFDYVLQAVLEGDYSLYGSQQLIDAWNRLGEPGRFGIKSKNSARFLLDELGFDVISDIGPQEMNRAYTSDERGKPLGRVWECMRLLDASVRD